jgi:hypothetical protein
MSILPLRLETTSRLTSSLVLLIGAGKAATLAMSANHRAANMVDQDRMSPFCNNDNDNERLPTTPLSRRVGLHESFKIDRCT